MHENCQVTIGDSLLICEKKIEKILGVDLNNLLSRRNFQCSKNSFLCKLENVCLSINLLCNAVNDCSDGSDERNCDNQQKFICLSKKENEMINLNLVCNFHVDCSDNTDESYCCKRNFYSKIYIDNFYYCLQFLKIVPTSLLMRFINFLNSQMFFFSYYK